MFKRSRMAVLVAGALFAAQAGAHSIQNEISWSDEFPPPAQLTVFNPDGSSYSITPVNTDVAALDSVLWFAGDDTALPQHLTVLGPEGSVYSYELTPIEAVVMVEPFEFSIDPLALNDDMSEPTEIVAIGDDSIDFIAMDDDASLNVAAVEDDASIEVAALEDDISFDVAALEDDFSIDPVALNDDEAPAAPTYVAHFVSPPAYTGVLEEEATS